jgi:hypothetical protein
MHIKRKAAASDINKVEKQYVRNERQFEKYIHIRGPTVLGQGGKRMHTA